MNSGKPLVAVSSCLLGQAVRYDGRAKPTQWIIEELGKHVDFMPLCPETGAGLGIPRPPVRLTSLPAGVHALGTQDMNLDVTEPIETWIRKTLPELSSVAACILKARSPSCGYLSAPLFTVSGGELASVSGLFAGAVRYRYEDLLIVDEEILATVNGRVQFLRALDLD